MAYTVYILRCADDTLYTGIARDAEKRLAAHNAGRGAKYTKNRVPCRIAYRERAIDRSAALKRELDLKKLTHAEKEALVLAYENAAPEPRVITALTEADFVEMAEIERRYYGDEAITDPSEAYDWYRAYPRSTLAVRADGKIAGFVNLFPLKHEVFLRYAAGEVNDKYLIKEDLTDESESAKFGMQLSCVAVLPEYRGTGLALRLVAAAAETYATGSARGLKILCDTATPAGAALSKRLGLKYACKTHHGTALYMGRYATFYKRLAALAPESLRADSEN